MNVKDLRRENLRALAKKIGGISQLAKRLEKSQSQISHVIGLHPVKNIGDNFAAEIERVFGKPPGWLDKEHSELAEILGIDVNEREARYAVNWLPLFTWDEYLQLLLHSHVNHNVVKQHLPSNIAVSAETIAIKIDDPNFLQTKVPQLQKPCILIIDTNFEKTVTEYLLCRSRENNHLSIEPRAAIKSNSSNHKIEIIGALIQIQLNF